MCHTAFPPRLKSRHIHYSHYMAPCNPHIDRYHRHIDQGSSVALYPSRKKTMVCLNILMYFASSISTIIYSSITWWNSNNKDIKKTVSRFQINCWTHLYQMSTCNIALSWVQCHVVDSHVAVKGFAHYGFKLYTIWLPLQRRDWPPMPGPFILCRSYHLEQTPVLIASKCLVNYNTSHVLGEEFVLQSVGRELQAVCFTCGILYRRQNRYSFSRNSRWRARIEVQIVFYTIDQNRYYILMDYVHFI